MALYIPRRAEAYAKLQAEGIDVRPYEDADSDALDLNFTNQMPQKALVATDVQWGRLLAKSGHDVRVNFLYPDKSTEITSDQRTYRHPWSVTINKTTDISILTGTGFEDKKLTLEAIPTLNTLRDIIERDRENSGSSLYICWAAQLALLWDSGIHSTKSDTKLSGVYPQELHELRPPALPRFVNLLHDDLSRLPRIETPVSRFRSIDPDDLRATESTIVPIFSSRLSGLGLAYAEEGNRFYSFNHGEYDRFSLAKEYVRDCQQGVKPETPYNYDLDRAYDPGTPPWQAVAQIIVNRLLDSAIELRRPIAFDKKRMREPQVAQATV